MASHLTAATLRERRSRWRLMWVRTLASDHTSLALFAVFLIGSAFFIWRATFAQPLALRGYSNSQYNQLADAFLHFHLWVAHVPNGVLGGGNPYNPAERPSFLFAYPDYSLYGHYLYITWGPAPVLVWLVPLHLLGFEPSASVIILPFAIFGLGFALATLRMILRRVGEVKMWICVLSGLTLACASVLPYAVRFPLVYYQAVASAYCFTMAGLWLAVSALVEAKASLRRLALMSVCFGLATNSRPTLGLTALVLVAVFLILQRTRPRGRGVGWAILGPFTACVLLLASYDFARFGNPVEYGTKYQIAGISTYTAHFGKLSYLAPGLWAYLLAPPRLDVIFPFLLINYPQVSYPFSLPAHYISLSEETGGLLFMAPIVVFLAALPWLWRRRPSVLGALGPLLIALTATGLACMAFLAYEIYTTSERYETDYMTLLLLSAIAAWLGLMALTKGRRRRVLSIVGALLMGWSCVIGVAISLQEIEQDQGMWRALVGLGSPLSTVIAKAAGHPVIAEVYTPNITRAAPNYDNFGTEVTGFSLRAHDVADLTIVSPDSRQTGLVADTAVGPALAPAKSLAVRITGPDKEVHTYRLVAGSRRVSLPIHLNAGINQLVMRPLTGPGGTSSAEASSEAQVLIHFLHFALVGEAR